MRWLITIMMTTILAFIAGCGSTDVSFQNKSYLSPGSEMRETPIVDNSNWNAYHDEGMGIGYPE